MERTSESFNRQHKDTRQSILWMRQRLARWFDTNQRTFIWRSQQRNPYIVLVAETMLQQTQVWRVEPILQRFLARFPTIEALASASKAEVIAAWHGLGYNRRA
ncbi:MAG: A/G-specific adenine glycosylase, partial [Chlorobi bacterium]|nr:A/G-specific adenine glycosylase [Chlorobiota bacterium]